MAAVADGRNSPEPTIPRSTASPEPPVFGRTTTETHHMPDLVSEAEVVDAVVAPVKPGAWWHLDATRKDRGGDGRKYGVQLRDARKTKANQDLLYRSEYLATLVSNVAAIETSPTQQLQKTLAASPVPYLIAASANLHQLAQAQRSTPRGTPRGTDSLRPHTAPALFGLETTIAPRAGSARGSGRKSQDSWRRQEDTLTKTSNVLEAFHECSADVNLHTTMMLREHLLSRGQTPSQDRALEATVPPNPLDMLRIPAVPGIPRGALYGDHAEAAEMEVARHAGRCRHVARLKEEDMPETSEMTLRFARHYWNNRAQGEDLAALGMQESPCRRFRRVDGHDDHMGTHKFCLMEGASLLRRNEGRDPFNSHALVTMDQPVQVLAEGHYFEIQVVSLFRTPGRPDRPKELGRRNRTEGLVIGMTATPPAEFNAQMRSATDVPRAWCVATSGKYYAAEVPAEQPKRPVSQDRVRTAPPWHRRVGKSEQLRCCWPPVPSSGVVVRRQLDWSIAIGEGDTLGMLITPFGGIVVTVNGERQLFLPDAGVPMGAHFYPLVEAYNHVRSVRALPGSLPPK